MRTTIATELPMISQRPAIRPAGKEVARAQPACFRIARRRRCLPAPITPLPSAEPSNNATPARSPLWRRATGSTTTATRWWMRGSAAKPEKPKPFLAERVEPRSWSAKTVRGWRLRSVWVRGSASRGPRRRRPAESGAVSRTACARIRANGNFRNARKRKMPAPREVRRKLRAASAV